MATNNKNRFIKLPSDWSRVNLETPNWDWMNPLFSNPVEITTKASSLVLNAIFNDNALAFLCDKDGRLILRKSGDYVELIDEPIKGLAPYGKSGIISSPARSTNIDITFKKTTSSSEENIIYDTKKVTTITEKIKDFTWRNTGHGNLYLNCSTSGWKNGALSDLVSSVHGILKDELSNANNWPVPDILGIISDDNDARDTYESVMTEYISWPAENSSELCLYRSLGSLFNIRYSRRERDVCNGAWDYDANDGKGALVKEFTQSVKETFESDETYGDQFGLVFPLLLGSSKIEITASISTRITSKTDGGRELKAEELSEVPVFITWGKIGEKLISDNGCVLDARMPDLGVNGEGATKGYPTFTGINSQSDAAIQIMMNDTSTHSKVYEIPDTHVMWFKLGFGINELFKALGNIVLLETTGEEPPDFDYGHSYTATERSTSASISVGVSIKVKVVG